MNQKYCHLSLDERRTIYHLLGRKISKTEIARILGRHRATIFREVQRNSYWDIDDHKMNDYYPVTAQEYARQRREKLKRLIRNEALRAFVIEKLHFPWSPDQIAGYLKALDIEGFYVCRETIYDFIYSTEGRSLNLYRCLRQSFKNRRKRYTRKPRYLRGIPQEWSISNRPAEVKNRDNFGHWEGDLMIFKREFGQVNITTLVERKSRYCVLIKNQNRRSETVVGQIKDKLTALPRYARRSLTLDRGSEFSAWKDLQKPVELGSYYCDPRSPWQKGTNENTNSRIRQFLPSETNLNEFSMADLNAVAKRINHTPRRCLNYRTPHEVFYNHLHQTEDQIACLT